LTPLGDGGAKIHPELQSLLQSHSLLLIDVAMFNPPAKVSLGENRAQWA
jgi:hypothetical protein